MGYCILKDLLLHKRLWFIFSAFCWESECVIGKLLLILGSFGALSTFIFHFILWNDKHLTQAWYFGYIRWNGSTESYEFMVNTKFYLNDPLCALTCLLLVLRTSANKRSIYRSVRFLLSCKSDLNNNLGLIYCRSLSFNCKFKTFLRYLGC